MKQTNRLPHHGHLRLLLLARLVNRDGDFICPSDIRLAQLSIVARGPAGHESSMLPKFETTLAVRDVLREVAKNGWPRDTGNGLYNFHHELSEAEINHFIRDRSDEIQISYRLTLKTTECIVLCFQLKKVHHD